MTLEHKAFFFGCFFVHFIAPLRYATVTSCPRWCFVKSAMLSGAFWRRGGKSKESSQLRLWNWNSISNSPVAPRRLSCEISVNQRGAETSTNVN